MVEPRDTIEIVNVVGSTGIGQEMNLKQLTLDLEGANYDPKRFPGLVYRTEDPKTVTLIFGSGKIVCTGAKSIDDVYRGTENVFQSLKKYRNRRRGNAGDQGSKHRCVRGPTRTVELKRSLHRPWA